MTEDTLFHIARGDQAFGPYRREDIIYSVKEGGISTSDHVFDPQTQSWRPLGEFFAITQQEPLSSPPLCAPTGRSQIGPVDYKSLPLLQKSGNINLIASIGVVLLFLVGLPVLALPPFVFATFMYFRGPVYSKKKNADGTLVRFGKRYACAPLFFSVVIAIWVVVQMLGL